MYTAVYISAGVGNTTFLTLLISNTQRLASVLNSALTYTNSHTPTYVRTEIHTYMGLSTHASHTSVHRHMFWQRFYLLHVGDARTMCVAFGDISTMYRYTAYTRIQTNARKAARNANAIHLSVCEHTHLHVYRCPLHTVTVPICVCICWCPMSSS